MGRSKTDGRRSAESRPRHRPPSVTLGIWSSAGFSRKTRPIRVSARRRDCAPSRSRSSNCLPQPALTRLPITGFTESSGWAGHEELTVEFSYTLWRYPEDRSDPRNEIELDEQTRRAIDEEPPWGRPAWLVEQVQLFRYPMLWSAVRTAWQASPDPERHALARCSSITPMTCCATSTAKSWVCPRFPRVFRMPPLARDADGRGPGVAHRRRPGLFRRADRHRPVRLRVRLPCRRECRLHDRAASGQPAVSPPGDHDPPTMRSARAGRSCAVTADPRNRRPSLPAPASPRRSMRSSARRG